LHAGLATYAAIAVEIDDAVVAAKQRSHRADGYTWSVVAVIASEHGKEAASVGIFALLYVLDPGAESTERDFVLGLASDCAGVTADAFAMVYDEAVFHLMDASSIDFSLLESIRLRCVSHGTQTKVYATFRVKRRILTKRSFDGQRRKKWVVVQSASSHFQETQPLF
jgi:hypothetical protein